MGHVMEFLMVLTKAMICCASALGIGWITGASLPETTIMGLIIYGTMPDRYKN